MQLVGVRLEGINSGFDSVLSEENKRENVPLEEMSCLNHWFDIPVLSVGHLLSAEMWVWLRVPNRHCASPGGKVVACYVTAQKLPSKATLV